MTKAKKIELGNINNRISSDAIKKYKLDELPQDYFITSFERIGMFDPFPDEIDDHVAIPMDDGDLVYAEDRFVFSSSPTTMYVPSNMVLFQLMRACIGIKSADELWFVLE